MFNAHGPDSKSLFASFSSEKEVLTYCSFNVKRPCSSVDEIFRGVFAAGFFASGPVQTAAVIGGGAAVVSAIVGVFTILRGQSFAGHALADVSSAGGAASFLLGVSPMLGFLGMAVRSTTGAAISVMFGSMFAIPASLILPATGVAGGVIAGIMIIYRPLLLSSLDSTLAEVQGINVRLIGLLHLLMLSLAVTLSAMTIGAILSTALLIGPAAAALRLTRRPGAAIGVAALIGLGSVLGGILLAYDSYNWIPGHGWPVSFFIVSIIFAVYLLAAVPGRRARRHAAGVLRPG
jgi:zinc/manganese transport system permease protein